MTELTCKQNYRFQRRYMHLTIKFIGRALEAFTAFDPQGREYIKDIPTGFTFGITILPDGSRMIMEKDKAGHLRYLGSAPDIDPDIEMGFKHVEHAFLLFTFRESTAQSFAHNRLVIVGDVTQSMQIVRCMLLLQCLILPKFLAIKIVKGYPHTPLFQKLWKALRIYSGVWRVSPKNNNANDKKTLAIPQTKDI